MIDHTRHAEEDRRPAVLKVLRSCCAHVERCRVEDGYRVRRRSAGSTQVRAKNPGRTLPRRTRVPGAACYRIGYPSWPVETTTCSAAFSRINLPSA